MLRIQHYIAAAVTYLAVRVILRLTPILLAAIAVMVLITLRERMQ